MRKADLGRHEEDRHEEGRHEEGRHEEGRHEEADMRKVDMRKVDMRKVDMRKVDLGGSTTRQQPQTSACTAAKCGLHTTLPNKLCFLMPLLKLFLS
jgi:hypothetical protein